MSRNEALMTEWANCAERRTLGASVRRLLDAVVTTGASPSELSAAAAAIDEVTDRLVATAPRQDMSGEPDPSAGGHMSLVGGLAHPAAPQLTLEATPGAAVGEVVIGPVFEGGPRLVHGGVIALLVDHVMGFVANRGLAPAMTVRLALRYRRPTPLGKPLTVAARLDRVDGRRLHLSASITANGEVTAEADAIFVRLTPGSVDQVFVRRT
jgi:acyl-coenzyme A thioesterase PaaI-like protein